MQRAVIFDIDGTLADNSIRQKILMDNSRDWHTFFKNMGDDAPVPAVLEIYQVLQKTNTYKMLIVSGRPDNYRKLTEQWLVWNNIIFDELYMRSAKDQRSDVDVKRDILQHLREKYDIAFVFDDRSAVVEMWRNEGITCFQCQDNNF